MNVLTKNENYVEILAKERFGAKCLDRVLAEKEKDRSLGCVVRVANKLERAITDEEMDDLKNIL